MGTRKRYAVPTDHLGRPRPDAPSFVQAYKDWRHGDGPEPDHEEIEVVEVSTPNGPRRVFADRVNGYKATLDFAASEDLSSPDEQRKSEIHRQREIARQNQERDNRVAAAKRAVAEAEARLSAELADLGVEGEA